MYIPLGISFKSSSRWLKPLLSCTTCFLTVLPLISVTSTDTLLLGNFLTLCLYSIIHPLDSDTRCSHLLESFHMLLQLGQIFLRCHHSLFVLNDSNSPHYWVVIYPFVCHLCTGVSFPFYDANLRPFITISTSFNGVIIVIDL